MRIGVLVFLLLLPGALAADQLVINSQDWVDVYSGMLHSRLEKTKASYIIDDGHGLVLQDTLDRQLEEVAVYESVDNPHIRNYHNNLIARGFDAERIFIEDSLNTRLAEDTDAQGYIVTDARYPQNAVSIAPYAVRKGYYVLFADQENIDEIEAIIAQDPGLPLILYGYLDRSVSDALSLYGPQIINEGDKFSNNVRILEMFIDEFGGRQILLTNGAFLEPQFFQGTSPVLFIGQSNIPEQTLSYLDESNITNAMLIGYDLFDNAVTLKNRAGMKIIVKFAKGIDANQYALDIYSLPVPEYEVSISAVDYNTYSGMLEVSYFNPTGFPAFMIASHEVLSEDESIAVVGDEEAVLIDSESTLTSAYEVELSEFQDEELVLSTNLLYGGDRSALEYLSQIQTGIDFVSYEDASAIEIEKVAYDKPAERFSIMIKNTGTVRTFAKPLIRDVIINNRPETLAGDIKPIEPGSSEEFRIRAELSEADIEDNEKVVVGARFGRREESLSNYIEQEFILEIETLPLAMILYIAAGALAAAIFAFIIFRRKKRKRGKNRQHLPKAPPPKR